MFLAGAALLLLVLVWRSLDRPLLRETKSFLWCVTHNRPEELFAYTTPEERTSMHLTRDRWLAIYKRFVWPRLRRIEQLGSIEVSTSGEDDSLAMALTSFRLPDGRVAQCGIDAAWTEDGTKAAVVWTSLKLAWIMEAKVRNDSSPSPVISACYRGLLEDRDDLKAMGIDRLYVNPTRGAREIDDLFQSNAAYLANLDLKASMQTKH